MSEGALFSQYFMDEGIVQSTDWQSIDAHKLDKARALILAGIEDFDARHQPDEGNTETDFIRPLLTLLGWEFSVQERIADKGRHDVPDYLLYLDADAKAAATKEKSPAARYRLGVSIVEAKRWNAPLDRAEPGQAGAPSTQMLRYLGNADGPSNGNIRFGILTNGRCWRLYDHKASSRLEGFVEIDLKEAVGLVVPAEKPDKPDDAGRADHILRQFLWLFARQAFVPDIGGATRLTRAVSDSRSFEARVTDQLAKTVFDTVFPKLANALWMADPLKPDMPSEGYLSELREAALTWLYRLLFVLYAEDRSLLPTGPRREGLKTIRRAVAEAVDRKDQFSSLSEFDSDLRRLWRRIDIGDRGIGVPPYNGGLFKAERSALLARTELPDEDFAPLLDAMSRETFGERRRMINYRDLNVRHLGSVYERLLEFDLALVDGEIAARPQTFARKTSGSYYTPEELVMLVIRRTVGPLLEEKRKIFEDAVDEVKRTKQAKENAEYPLARLQQHDPATEFLTLRICDPAMGSGHFLVSLVDYLADQVMLATTQSAALVIFGDYRSKLLGRLEDIRNRIKSNAAENNWHVDDSQLIDRQLVRRIILKRVIHGVDKNPMAVELAKLSLWLHTFTVGAPLSFLDHHLRCGDSLFGEWVSSGMDRLERGGLFTGDELTTAEQAIMGMAQVEELTDADIGEVHESARNFDEAREKIKPLERYFSLVQGYRWIEGSADDALKLAKKYDKESWQTSNPVEAGRLQDLAFKLKRQGMALDVMLDRGLGEPDAVLDMCYGRIGNLRDKSGTEDDPALGPLVKAVGIGADANFLHWELAFPTVWKNWRSPTQRSGGFDAIIGNPPWDRLKMQEVEWFASRKPEIAKATRAADRNRMVRALKDSGDALSGQYERASEMAALASRMANHKDGQFPLLGKGDTNLYSLFVERAMQLVKPNGIVGLLIPSGIAGDLGASAFFRSVSTTGRLSSLFDYENKKIFFPDVHASFKFCAIVFGGEARKFNAAQCGFFLRSTNDNDLAEQTFPLAPADFAAVNPNTGTAPVFRNVRDADLTTAIYARLPVLARKEFAKGGSGPDEGAAMGDLVGGPKQTSAVNPWAVKYLRMFDMTNDSHLFRTRAELQTDGWYPVDYGIMKKGDAEVVPLYEGKMVQAFDHRAASVVVNPENLHRPSQPETTTVEQHQDPAWLPDPQFYVNTADLPELGLPGYVLGYKEITAPTNARTFISALFPSVAFGNKVPLFVPVDQASYRNAAVCLCANTNAFVFDFVTRQKVQGQTLNLFIVEQLPVIPPADYNRKFGKMTAREIVAREVLHLTYTAHDMAAFARDMGYDGEPFIWNDADRRQRRARLDALYFHLYGIGKEDAEYILSTFPIVRRHDEAEFNGRFVTRDLILAQMDALAAGDVDALISLR